MKPNLNLSPNLTISILSFKRPHHLNDLLQRLHQQQCDLSIIIIDADSLKSGQPIVNHWQKKLTIKYISSPTSNRAHCRNQALNTATTPFLAFLDDDCIPYPNWCKVAQNIVTQWRPSTAYIFGAVTPFHPHHPLVKARMQKYQDWVHHHIQATPHIHTTTILDTKNCILNRQYLSDHHLQFDPLFHRGQDTDLALQCRRAGGVGIFFPSLKVQHYELESIVPFLTRAFEQGCFRAKVDRKWSNFATASPTQNSRKIHLDTLSMVYYILHSVAAKTGYYSEKLLSNLIKKTD